MKKSKYNILFEHNGSKYAFNSFTCALNKVNDNFINILDCIESNTKEKCIEDKQLIDNMLQAGYLIDDDHDELKALQFFNFNKKFNDDKLYITIAPTLACNFACPYCYETAKPGIMTQEVQDKTIEFIRKNLKNKKHLIVLWFGGEPLLAKDVIYNLSSRMISMCEEMDINYSATMVSNSYLLDEETAINLKKFRIGRVQVTIDGPEKTHNLRRKLKNSNEPTFHKILRNICNLKKVGIPIVIRINVDKTNVHSVNELIDVLETYDLKDQYAYLGYTRSYDESCPTKMSSDCLDLSEYGTLSATFAELLAKRGFDNIIKSTYPSVKAIHCSANALNSFIIAPTGDLYKCENIIGDINHCIGNIFTSCNENHVENVKHKMNGIDWLLYSPFEYNKCRECNILPICMGGCDMIRKKTSQPSCINWKYTLIDMLKLKCDYSLAK